LDSRWLADSGFTTTMATYGLKVFAFLKLAGLPFTHKHVFDASAAPLNREKRKSLAEKRVDLFATSLARTSNPASA
jgi:hypothetical protein